MKKNKVLTEKINLLTGILNMAETYEEIAAMRMRRVKNSVLSSREFLEGLNDTFRMVSYAYNVYLEKVKKSKKLGETVGKNGKTVVVLLSSNMGLYGDIVRSVLRKFERDLPQLESEEKNIDLVVAGRVGKSFFDNLETPRKYSYFELSDGGEDSVNFKKLMDFVLDYSKIIVYHGIFVSVLDQRSQTTVVTGEARNIVQEYEEQGQIMFIFEPNVEEVIDHFENEILTSMFEQVTFESNLSKHAARMVSLYSATDNIKKRLANVEYEYRKYRHRVTNNKQLNVLAGVSLWS